MLKLVGNGCHGNLAAVSSVSLFIKRMTGPQANALKVKPVQSFATHKFSVCWLNNSWSVGYLHATDQVLFWMFFLLQDKLAKHHIRKTTLWCQALKCSVNAEVDDFQMKISYTLIRSGLASFCILLLGNIFRLSAINCSAKNENIVNIINVASTQWVQNFNLSLYALHSCSSCIWRKRFLYSLGSSNWDGIGNMDS